MSEHEIEKAESGKTHDIPNRLLEQALSLFKENGEVSSAANAGGGSLAPGMDSQCIQQLDDLKRSAPKGEFNCSSLSPGPPSKMNQCSAEIPSAPTEVSQCSYVMPKKVEKK